MTSVGLRTRLNLNFTTMEIKTVGLACDHAGFPLKKFVVEYLESHGYAYKDFGLAWIPEIAELIRQHNDANVLVMPGRFVDNKKAAAIMDEFFKATFEGGRHQRRIEKIDAQV